jgi:DNA (cytosine-5)-methyltransferase 1
MQKAQNGLGIGTHGDPAYTLDTTGAQAVGQPVPYRKAKRAQSSTDDESWVAAEQSNTINGWDVGERDTHAVATQMTVRRLTPRECERLQGFPDDWTLIPWRGKPADQCPDGPRYKALGNSMAVNCMEWIGERIAREAR